MLDLARSRLLLLIGTAALFVFTFHALNQSTSLRPYLSTESLHLSSATWPQSNAGDPVSLTYDPRTESDYRHAPPDVAKVSMLYGDNALYVRAMDTHIRHARRHEYPAYVLRKELINGIWNKLLYLIHVMIAELHKGEEGARWWVDADSAVVNPALPLSIFLPPESRPEIHVLASKDQSGLNAGMFFIRVHEWSIKILAQAMTYEWHKPEVSLQFLEQTALYHELNNTANRKHVLYQPRIWYNTYEWHHAYEGDKGDMMVHFPGLEEDRWKHMENWLSILEGPGQAEWEMPLEGTKYPARIDEFWSMIDASEQTLLEGKQRLGNSSNSEQDLQGAIEKLETVLWSETDQIEAMKVASAAVHDILKAAHHG